MKRPALLARLAIALLVVLPLTLMLIAATASSSSADGPLLQRFTTVAAFFMLLGPVLTVVFTLLHTALERLVFSTSRIGSVALGVILGCLTVLPLVLEPQRFVDILFGAFGGGLYALLLNLARRSGAGAERDRIPA